MLQYANFLTWAVEGTRGKVKVLLYRATIVAYAASTALVTLSAGVQPRPQPNFTVMDFDL